jgi:catechol 2,3-dioxygenase-like lactoylglutathione lyase family enzyme
MIRLDHLALAVKSVEQTKDWYVSVLGLQVEFAAPNAVGLKDDGEFTLILTEGDDGPSQCRLYFQVGDVASTHAQLAGRGVAFLYPPQVNDWGYGAGLLDPDGRVVGLWDEASMASHSDGHSES